VHEGGNVGEDLVVELLVQVPNPLRAAPPRGDVRVVDVAALVRIDGLELTVDRELEDRGADDFGGELFHEVVGAGREGAKRGTARPCGAMVHNPDVASTRAGTA